MDKSSKLLLALIAIGLWLNALLPFIRPVRAAAEGSDDISEIAHDIHNVVTGLCLNGNLCGTK